VLVEPILAGAGAIGGFREYTYASLPIYHEM
jgi:hypothetical protein